ncbi:MAG: GntR family transcriptional regulator [Byssovorax sp.]
MATKGEVRRVSDEILKRIVSGAYPAGLRLPSEADLGGQLACGRSTIREALRHLTGLGVVHSRRGSGAMVLDFRREGTPALLPSYVLAGRFDRPAGALARELLGVRTVVALQAVRMAARYADDAGIAEARGILARAPALESDRVAHALNELDMFRALVCASGIWPAVWLANVFWAPMRDLHGMLAGAVGAIAAGYQLDMERLIDLIEVRDEQAAEAHLSAFFARVDANLLGELEWVLEAASLAAPPEKAVLK